MSISETQWHNQIHYSIRAATIQPPPMLYVVDEMDQESGNTYYFITRPHCCHLSAATEKPNPKGPTYNAARQNRCPSTIPPLSNVEGWDSSPVASTTGQIGTCHFCVREWTEDEGGENCTWFKINDKKIIVRKYHLWLWFYITLIKYPTVQFGNLQKLNLIQNVLVLSNLWLRLCHLFYVRGYYTRFPPSKNQNRILCNVTDMSQQLRYCLSASGIYHKKKGVSMSQSIEILLSLSRWKSYRTNY